MLRRALFTPRPCRGATNTISPPKPQPPLLNFLPAADFYPKGKENDRADVYEQLETAGYRIVRGPEGAAQLTGGDEKIVLVQAESDNEHRRLPYAIDRKEGDLTLPQITQAAIEALYNAKGFFP